MRTITTNLYTFAELTPDAQAVAITEVDSEYSSDFVIDDAKAIGLLFGLEINQLLYAGFWSQGDGASFTGKYRYTEGGLEAVKAYAPNDEELHEIIAQLPVIDDEVSITQHGMYFHENSMQMDTDNELVVTALKSYAKWIYKRLEDEYEYSQSRESMVAVIEANGYEFYEDGTLYGG